MSEELFPAVTTGDQAPATLFSAEEIAAIQALLAQSVEIAEAAMQRIRNAAGPKPGKTPQDFIISINMGAGYLRQCRDTIDRMFREYHKVLLQQRCDHSCGPIHIGRKAMCKICDWEFVLGPKGYAPQEKPRP